MLEYIYNERVELRNLITVNRNLDGKEEIKKLLEVVEYLTQEEGEQICPEDVVDVFRGGKTAKIKQKNWDTLPVYPTDKRKVLKTKELVQFALADLVVRGLVQEKIILRKTFEGGKGLSQANANGSILSNKIIL